MLVFLMCSERSGSNLITKAMNGHSNICGPSPKHLFNPVVRNFFRYEPLDEPGNWNELLTDVEQLLNVSFSQWRCAFSREELRRLAPTGDLRALLANVFFEEARASGKQHCFIKENQLYEFLEFLLMEMPEARYVYQTRDPRDMSLSWRNNSAHAGGLLTGAERWKLDQQRFLRAHSILRRFGRSYWLAYEDLISEPARALSDICSFLGVPFEEEMLRFHEDELTMQNAQSQEAWDNLAKPFLSDNHGKYKEKLSSHEIAQVERICWPEMHALGYVPDTGNVDLEALDEGALLEMARQERQECPAEPEPGIRDNARAKRVFYQKRFGGLTR